MDVPRPRPRCAGMTLIELVVVMAVVAILGAVGYGAYAGTQQRSRDNAAIALADQLAGNYQHAAALTGAFPASLQAASWASSAGALGPLTEFGAAAPPIFTSGPADTPGTLFRTWTDAAGGQIQMIFKAAGGTGQIYCRDLNGVGKVGSDALATNGPWSGCP
jgi:prepilin-type N-terminal cleavage/methylation domain-containing protein